jgi:oligopeptide/dipeptide ABC transporter ATP-binding protein
MSVILRVKDLQVTFPVDGKDTAAVDGISFSLRQGKVLGLVGESGCGKTVTALSILRLIEAPGRIHSGQILYYGEIPGISTGLPPPGQGEEIGEKTLGPMDHTESALRPEEEEVPGGTDLLGLREEEVRKVRGNKIAMIFQEPMTSLNPVFTVGDQILEAILLHQDLSKSAAKQHAIEMLRKVRIPDPEKRFKDYPHQMSGGMRQRVMTAMALACKPDILIADEPTTALDVTIQAQILELIREIIEEMHMSMILITHDLGVVAQVCDDVIVMYAGMIAEQAPVQRLFRRPRHPYTIGLLESIPPLFGKEERLHTIAGMVPPLGEFPEGCRFADRCPRAVAACRAHVPKFKYVGEGQTLRCLNY